MHTLDFSGHSLNNNTSRFCARVCYSMLVHVLVFVVGCANDLLKLVFGRPYLLVAMPMRLASHAFSLSRTSTNNDFLQFINMRLVAQQQQTVIKLRHAAGLRNRIPASVT